MPELTQRSMAWRVLRLGDVTASRFKDIKKPRSKSDAYPLNNGDLIGETAFLYLEELLAEIMFETPQDRLANVASIQHGNFWEDVHREHAQAELLQRFGKDLILPTGDLAYISHPTEAHIGGSPDYGVGDDAGGEMKCPFDPKNHVGYLRRGVDWWLKKHVDQVQGLMWITGWKTYYVSSFYPSRKEYRLILWKIERDELHINRLASRVLAFRDLLLEEYTRLGGTF